MTIPKFRAWDKKSKVLSLVGRIDFFKRQVSILSPSYHSVGFENIKLMQSTGMVDENGKEIFEGDIVKVLDSLYTVFYDSERGSFRLRPHDKRWHTDYMSNFSGGGNFEIIGNIYEGVIDELR